MARVLRVSLALLVLAEGNRRIRRQASFLKGGQRPDMNDEYEYGDRESAVSGADSSDFSIHQFLTEDDARTGTTETGDNAAATEIARQQAMAADDHFNSEDTPDTTDSFAQTGRSARKQRASTKSRLPSVTDDEYEYGDRESAVSSADSSDFSIHQFLTEDDGRTGTTETGDNAAATEIARQQAMAADDHFNSEDTPDTTDSFAQTGRKLQKSK